MKKHKLAPPCINKKLNKGKDDIHTNQSAKYRRINGVFVGTTYSTVYDLGLLGVLCLQYVLPVTNLKLLV
jgi:hypothetical protein